MTSLTRSALLVALMQTAISLPMCLLSLPAGVLGDLLDRRRLILSTMSGTAGLLREEDVPCSVLRRMVTSPGGTAAAGLAELERQSVRGAIIDSVIAAMRRAGELG